MSSPDEDSPHSGHTVYLFLQKHVHFYIKHLRCIETGKASGKRRGYTLDRTPVHYRTHTPHTLTLEDWEKSMHIWKVYENSILNPEQ